jgi:hypothetical protein
MGREKPPVSHQDFDALVLFTKQLASRLERLENGQPPMSAEERLKPSEPGTREITTRDQHQTRLNELEFRIEGIERHLENQLRGG